MRTFLMIIAMLGIMGCASAKLRAPLSFSMVESISYGSAKTPDLVRLFGNPDKIIPMDSQTTIWSYEEIYPTLGLSERLNISVDIASSRVIGAIWIPHPDESVVKKEGILEHFKNARFSKKPVGWISKHHFSRDEVYVDDERGISFYLNTFHNTVQHIGFSQPTTNRRLSTQ